MRGSLYLKINVTIIIQLLIQIINPITGNHYPIYNPSPSFDNQKFRNIQDFTATKKKKKVSEKGEKNHGEWSVSTDKIVTRR